MTKLQKRAYDSTARQQKAQHNRQSILNAAEALFTEKGFDKTMIKDIAAQAKVSMPTIYALFKSKTGVLRAIMDECLPELTHAALVDQAYSLTCPKQRLAMAASIARQLYDAERNQSALLQSSGCLSPELKRLESEREQRRYERLQTSVDWMAEQQVLKLELSVTQAHDVFWALTGRDMYRLLVIDRAWSSDNYEQWLSKNLELSLLKR